MATKGKFKSDAFEAIHSAVEDMVRAGTVDKQTLRSFDEACLSRPTTFDAKQIKALRERNHVSQPVFARHLNTSESTVQKWETGAKRPSMALKLLTVVEKHGLEVCRSRFINGRQLIDLARIIFGVHGRILAESADFS